MFEVKITVAGAQITFATFEAVNEGNAARNAAVRFAKQVDRGWEVEVINVADENNREKAFGIVYHRDAEF